MPRRGRLERKSCGQYSAFRRKCSPPAVGAALRRRCTPADKAKVQHRSANASKATNTERRRPSTAGAGPLGALSAMAPLIVSSVLKWESEDGEQEVEKQLLKGDGEVDEAVAFVVKKIPKPLKSVVFRLSMWFFLVNVASLISHLFFVLPLTGCKDENGIAAESAWSYSNYWDPVMKKSTYDAEVRLPFCNSLQNCNPACADRSSASFHFYNCSALPVRKCAMGRFKVGLFFL
jgi:hypothetical protein